MVKNVGEKIRSIRASKGYSQANVAEDLGITPGAYAKIERGETDPSAGRLMQIAKILDVNVKDLFSESMVAEDSKKYGYATRDEVENLTRLVKLLMEEFGKFRKENISVVHKSKKKKNK